MAILRKSLYETFLRPKHAPSEVIKAVHRAYGLAGLESIEREARQLIVAEKKARRVPDPAPSVPEQAQEGQRPGSEAV